MKAQFSFVGFLTEDQKQPEDVYVNLDIIPRIGDILNFEGYAQYNTYVRTVVWYISSDEDGYKPSDFPFVYIVVGPPRPNDSRFY